MLRCRVTSLDRDILRLAVPSLGALVAEPVFVLTDTAMVGHLGAPALAGLGIASTVLQTAVGLLIFLAYATTPIVARRLGAGDRPGALSAGVDGLWLALGLGVVLLATLLPLSPVIVGAFGVEAAVATAALDYLTIAWWGIPGMLLVLAATGVLRGLQDARTPLIVAAAGFTANIALNAALIYGSASASPARRSARSSRSGAWRRCWSPSWCARPGASTLRCAPARSAFARRARPDRGCSCAP